MTDRLLSMVDSANVAIAEGNFATAETIYRMVLSDTSPPVTGKQRVAHSEAAVFFARLAMKNGKYGSAIDWYSQAVTADPIATDIRVEYIDRCLLPMGLSKEAKVQAERAINIEPNNPKGHGALGHACFKLGDVKGSIEALDKQLAYAKLDRCTIAVDTGDHETVRRLCGEVIESGLMKGDALHCLGMVAYRDGLHEEAIDLYRRAIDEGANDVALVRWNMSLAMQSIGLYREGWEEYELRGKQRSEPAMAAPLRRFKNPWDGEPPPAKLHLHQEMGFGDLIALVRYAPVLIERGYDVSIEATDTFTELLKRSFPKARVMPKALDYPGALGIPLFDYQCPVLSLPYIMGTEVNTVPWPGPYIIPSAKKAETYREGLSGLKRKIGLCWSSGIRKEHGIWLEEYGLRKSMSFDAMSPIWSEYDCVSLQVGPERDTQRINAIRELLPEKPTWDDTAALMSCLDLVITVDTAVAHLAGAMGIPVWVLLQRDSPSWHWMSYRPGAVWNEKSPWYPSARLFRAPPNTRPHYWSDVVADVVFALRAL